MRANVVCANFSLVSELHFSRLCWHGYSKSAFLASWGRISAYSIVIAGRKRLLSILFSWETEADVFAEFQDGGTKITMTGSAYYHDNESANQIKSWGVGQKEGWKDGRTDKQTKWPPSEIEVYLNHQPLRPSAEGRRSGGNYCPY